MDSNCVNIRALKKFDAIPLSIGGTDSEGNVYSSDSFGLKKNGKRFLPIMGEFHFSRWEKEEWKESLLKMRAGGIQIVSTYVFWIHHEEEKDKWNFEGSRDIRAFLEICKEIKMPVWLRIGPFAHGECRNGGFPDWLRELEDQGVTLRSNDPVYLEFVKNFWAKLAEQVSGMMCKDGGPVLGIQLENEFGHVGGLWDAKEGARHMMILKKMAIDLGFETPYYTATGWGGAHVVDDEILPVLGGYVDAPWERGVEEMPACENFLFIPFHNDDNIGSDSGHKPEEFTFSVEKNPYLTAELGAGIQVTGHRRTYPFPEDIEANALCMLGSGANLLGYYMYHGGINPDGNGITLEECDGGEWGSDLPKKSYDFLTCIRESGEIFTSYGYLKKLHLFLEDFGEMLADMPVYLPDVLPSSAEDMHTKRVSSRIDIDKKCGFVFLNAHQRKRKMDEYRDMSVNINFGDDLVELKGINLPSLRCGIIPFGLDIAGRKLLATNAFILCKLGEKIVFYTYENVGNKVFFKWEDAGGKVTMTSTEDDRIILIERDEADKAFRNKNALYICQYEDSCIFEDEGTVKLITKHFDEKIKVISPRGVSYITPEIAVNAEVDLSAVYELTHEEKADTEGVVLYKDYKITLPQITENLHQLYLDVDYLGDRAEIYLEEKLVDDWFTTGGAWHIALKRFGYPKDITIRVYDSNNHLPQSQFDHMYFDIPVRDGCEIRGVKVITEYLAEIWNCENVTIV